MTRKISQRKARALLREVNALRAEREKQRSRWARNYPGGVHIATSKPAETARVAIQTARSLGHAVVAVENQDSVLYYALPLPHGE